MKRVRLIALDMDGTLLLSDHRTVPQENIDAICEADARGVRVAISTGRMLEDASDFARRLGLPVLIIAANGARASDGPVPGGEVFVRSQLPPGDASRAARILLGAGLIVNGFEDGRVTTADAGTGWIYHLVRRGLIEAQYGEDALFKAAERGVMKLFAVTGGFAGDEQDARIPQALEAVRRALPHLQVTSSSPGNVEVMPADAGKGNALAQMAARLGLAREQVMAVGDAENDLSMLRFAFHSVAMGNATQAVKAACRYRTGTNDECGVASVIRRALAAKEAEE